MDNMVKEEYRQIVNEPKQVFEQLYVHVFPKVARYISSRGGSFDDAKDLFQDALVVWYERSHEEGFVLDTTAEAYITGTVKYMWLRKTQKKRHRDDAEHIGGTLYEHPGEEHINTGKLLQLLEQTGKKCMDLLRAFYYTGSNMKQTARALGYGSEHSAAVQKYKCLEKVRATIKEKSLDYEAFID